MDTISNFAYNNYLNAMSFIHVLKSKLFHVNKIYTIKGSTIDNLYYKYLLIKFLTIFKNTILINYLSNPLLNYFDKNYDILKVEIQHRNYILTNSNLQSVVNFDKKYDINDVLMHSPGKIIKEIKHNNNPIKKLLENYSDKKQKYNHTLKNIFIIKNINYHLDDTILITYLGSKIKKELKLKDVIDLHILSLYS